MFKNDKMHMEIKERVETALDEIFLDYQTRFDMSGDIEPLDSFALDETTDRLTEIITDVLQFEFDYFRG